MSWADYLEKIRRRPEAERRRLALWFAVIITLAIVLVWVLNLKFVLDDRRPNSTIADSARVESRIGGLSFKERVIAGWKKITNQK